MCKSLQEDKLRDIEQANVVGDGTLRESVNACTKVGDVGSISQRSGYGYPVCGGGGGISTLVCSFLAENVQNSNNESHVK